MLDNVAQINSGLRYKEPPLMLRYADGRFRAAPLGDLPFVAGRGIAFGDLDNDGTVDAVMSVLDEHPLVLKGRPNANHWLTLALKGTRSNRFGIGVRVRAGRAAEADKETALFQNLRQERLKRSKP